MEDNFKYHSNYDEKSSFSDIVFGAEKPLLETELNEMQQIVGTKLKYLFNVLGSCVNTVYGSESESIFLDNKILHIKDCIVTTSSGNIFYVKDESISIEVGYKSYFKVWEEVEDYLSELKEYGNTKGSTLENTIKDPRLISETSRRTVLKHELMKGTSIPSDTEKVKYVGIGEYTDTGFKVYANGLLNETNKTLYDLTSELSRINIALGNKADSGHSHSLATQSSAGFMSAQDKIWVDDFANVKSGRNFANMSLNGVGNIDNEYDWNYVVAISEAGHGTLPNLPANWCIVENYFTYHFVKQVCTVVGGTSDCIPTVFVRTRWSDGAWSEWKENINTSNGANLYASASHGHGEYANKSIYGNTCISLGGDASSTWGANIAVGQGVQSKGAQTAAFGKGTISNQNCGLASGIFTEALNYQTAIGSSNNTSTATASDLGTAHGGTTFVIGNGFIDTHSNAFRVRADGQVFGGAYNSSGADYAEYEEWADGNPDGEDRVGYFVTYDENSIKKIRKANAGEWVLGVISGEPCIIGNADEDWMGRYILDDFGRKIPETFEYEEKEIDSETGEEKTVTKTVTHWKQNPNYDSKIIYTSRDSRKEWSAVGWMGVLYVRDDGTCQQNGFCKCADGGIATAATIEDYSYLTPIFRVINRVSDNVIRAVVKL